MADWANFLFMLHSSSVVKFVDEEDVNLEQVKVLDQLVVNQCCKMRAGAL